MNASFIGTGVDVLTRRWWIPVVRGVAAIIFGVLALVSPSIGMLALVIAWGAYALVDGVFNVILASRTGRAGGKFGWYLFEGVIGIVVGVLTFVYPGMTGLVLLSLIAAWAILTGIVEIAAAIELRNVMSREWLFAVAGILSVAFGIVLLARPIAGAIALVWIIGAYAIVFGVILVALGMRLRRWHREAVRELPVGAAPTPA